MIQNDVKKTVNRADFTEKVRLSNEACQHGDYNRAILLYTEALKLDANNYIIYSNRSAAYLKQGKFDLALEDACHAQKLCPGWPKAYYRQGVALQCLGRFCDSLLAFSTGLSHDPKSSQLLNAMKEAAIKSPLKINFESVLRHLNDNDCAQNAFILVTVIGQEMLAAKYFETAASLLQIALKIDDNSPKLRASVFSALSSAFWALGQPDKAIEYIKEDLKIGQNLEDETIEMRAYGNLGSAYLNRNEFNESIQAYQNQYSIADRTHNTDVAVTALQSLANAYKCSGDYANLLTMNQRICDVYVKLGRQLDEARQCSNIANVLMLTYDFGAAVDYYSRHLKLALHLGNEYEEAKAYCNLGFCYYQQRSYKEAIVYFENVLKLLKSSRIPNTDHGSDVNGADDYLECRTYAGLGHAFRCLGQYSESKIWYEKQLEKSLKRKNKISEGRSLSNLGILYQLLNEYQSALKLHQAHLAISKATNDRVGMGRAFGNIGNVYLSLGKYTEAVQHHKEELVISKETKDKNAEAATHGNLAIAYQSLKVFDMALLHYQAHLDIAKEIKDFAAESCALLNLANFLSSRSQFQDAIPFYEQYLMLSQEMADVDGESKACHFLGYVHYCLKNYREAVRYYNQDLVLVKDLKNSDSIARAYCNLGLAYLALEQYQQALDCQKHFLTVSETLTDDGVIINNKFRALGNIGDVLMKMQRSDEAMKMYHSQLNLAKSVHNLEMEAQACATLGFAYKAQKAYTKALSYHTQELAIRHEMKSVREECMAYNNIGNVYILLNKYEQAVHCYRDQLTKCLRNRNDPEIEAETYGNLAVAKTYLGQYDDAVQCFEKQLASMQLLEAVSPSSNFRKEYSKVFNYLGICYEKTGMFKQSLKYFEQFLKCAQNNGDLSDQDKAYVSIAGIWKKLKVYPKMLVSLEKRLVISHQLKNIETKMDAYSNLGDAHHLMRNYSQAILCYQNQYELSKQLENDQFEAKSCSNLGKIYYANQDYQMALRYFEIELNLSRKNEDEVEEVTALLNLSKTYEGMRNYEQSLRFQEFYWKKAERTATLEQRLESLVSRARLCDRLGNETLSVTYLNEAHDLSVDIVTDDEHLETIIAEIYFRFGLVYEKRADYNLAVQYFEKCVQIFEHNLLYENPLLLMTYRALQKIYFLTKKNDECLLIAEKCRRIPPNQQLLSQSNKHFIHSKQELRKLFENQKQSMIYYSCCENYLYRFLIKPSSGVYELSEVSLLEDDFHGPVSRSFEDELLLETNPGGGNKLRSYLKALFELSQCDKIEDSGFKRNTMLSSSNYSLSSLFSVGSISGVSTKSTPTQNLNRLTHRTTTSHKVDKELEIIVDDLRQILLPDCLIAMLNLGSSCQKSDLILVVEKELTLVPFQSFWLNSLNCWLSDRINLVMVNDFSHVDRLMPWNRTGSQHESGDIEALFVANSKRNSVMETVREAFNSNRTNSVCLNQNCLKSNVKKLLEKSEFVFMSVPILWSKMAFEFQPNKLDSSSNESMIVPSDTEGSDTTDDLLTFAELEEMDLRLLKLIVLHYDFDDFSQKCATNLINVLFNAGCGAILILLWPVPEVVLKIFYRAFFTALLQGTRTYRAHQEAVQVIKHTKQFSDATYWAGFALLGANIRVSKNIPLQGRAIYDVIMNESENKYREVFRVLLHLIEKSLQRIHRGQRNAMYTTQSSIENKIGIYSTKNKNEDGGLSDTCDENLAWKVILKSVGFRFEPSPTKHQTTDRGCIFFPQSDPDDKLSQSSASLQAILSLTPTTMSALRLLMTNKELIFDVIDLFRNLIDVAHFGTYKLNLSTHLWGLNGCHELLAALGFELAHVHENKIVLAAGKNIHRNQIDFVLQTLLTIFDTFEAPKSLLIDESSRGEPDGGFESDEKTSLSVKQQSLLQVRNFNVEINQKFHKLKIDDSGPSESNGGEMKIFEFYGDNNLGNETTPLSDTKALRLKEDSGRLQRIKYRDDADGKSLYDKDLNL